MAFCTQCGNKLPKATSKFCPECGSTVGEPKRAEPNAQVPAAEEKKAKGPGVFWQAVGIIVGLALGLLIVGAVADYVGAGFDLGSTVDCAKQAKPGVVTCGYCDEDMVLSGNPHAGKCRYCPSGTSCSGDICGALTCKSGSGGNGTVSPEPDVSVTPGPTSDGGGGGGYLADPPIDGNTGCPPQGYSGPRGSVDLQCSQMIEAGRCSFQSCACHYATSKGDASNAYYHTSDGAYYRCSGSGYTLDCTQAAGAVAQHCGPAVDNVNIIWGG